MLVVGAPVRWSGGQPGDSRSPQRPPGNWMRIAAVSRSVRFALGPTSARTRLAAAEGGAQAHDAGDVLERAHGEEVRPVLVPADREQVTPGRFLADRQLIRQTLPLVECPLTPATGGPHIRPSASPQSHDGRCQPSLSHLQYAAAGRGPILLQVRRRDHPQRRLAARSSPPHR